jgi:hypothetical protein
MTDSCNNWKAGEAMKCDDATWLVLSNNVQGDLNGGINAGNGLFLDGRNITEIPEIVITQEVAQQLSDDKTNGNTATRRVVMNGQSWTVSYVDNKWRFVNDLNSANMWDVNVFMETVNGVKTLSYEAEFYDANAPAIGQVGYQSGGQSSGTGSGSGPNAVDPCPCCNAVSLSGANGCAALTKDLSVDCASDIKLPEGFTPSDVAWCKITSPLCIPDVELGYAGTHQPFQKLYDTTEKALYIAMGRKSDAKNDATGVLSVRAKADLAATTIPATYTINDAAAAACDDEGGSLGFLAYLLGLLLCCLPIAGFMGYKHFQRTKADGSTWNSSGKAEAAGDANQYYGMEAGM